MSLWEKIDEVKKLHWVDVTHPLNNESPYWSGAPEGSRELCKVVFDYDEPLLSCQIHTYKFPGQFGTHVDFPVHFTPHAPASEAFDLRHMMYPLCVIDITPQMQDDIEYAITVEDILEWEKTHGRIPEGSFVALRTDWYKRWPDNDKLNNYDEEGGEHCPGWSLEALKFLFEERNIAMNGHETFDTDASSEAVKYDDLACERYVLATGHLQVELMANLDKVPETGGVILIAWPHIDGATGLPVRAAVCFE